VRVPRPAHVLAVSGALVAAGVLVGGTAYAATRAASADETYFACVNIATGAMRLIDPLAGQACNAAVGPGQEREISWSRTAGERGPQGPAGPRGPRGESDEDGAGGRLVSLEDLEGVRCSSGDASGRVEIHIQPPERGSGIQLICKTDDTVATTTPPRPTKPPLPTTVMPTSEPPQTTEPATEAPIRPPDAPPVGGGGEPGDDEKPAPEPGPDSTLDVEPVPPGAAPL